MTVLMTCVVIYIYTVIAFNFFRKFYRFQTPEGVEVFKCDNMFEVYNCKLSREVYTIRTEKKKMDKKNFFSQKKKKKKKKKKKPHNKIIEFVFQAENNL